MIDKSVIERFSPTSMMVMGLMEHLFTSSTLDSLFERHAQVQYTRNLLFGISSWVFILATHKERPLLRAPTHQLIEQALITLDSKSTLLTAF